MLTTHQIQAKLEENFELLTKLTSLGSAKLDAKSQAAAEEWSKTLHDNLMQLAGQADTNISAQQQQPPQAAAPAASAATMPNASGAAAR